jgi:hypothetical protein
VVDEFFFEVPEEALDDGIVQAGRLAGHRLSCPGVREDLAPGGVLVVDALVGVHQRALPILERLDGGTQGRVRQVDSR